MCTFDKQSGCWNMEYFIFLMKWLAVLTGMEWHLILTIKILRSTCQVEVLEMSNVP